MPDPVPYRVPTGTTIGHAHLTHGAIQMEMNALDLLRELDSTG